MLEIKWFMHFRKEWNNSEKRYYYGNLRKCGNLNISLDYTFTEKEWKQNPEIPLQYSSIHPT